MDALLTFLLDGDIQREFLSGLAVTLTLASLSGLLAFGLGFALAFLRVAGPGWMRHAAAAYVEIFRNTPLLIQLYFWYRGLQSAGLVLAPEVCAVIALSLYTGAYLSEVFRSGLLSVPREQAEAGLSLGLGRFQVYRMILLPQVMRMILPTLGNQVISLVKNSSLVAFITVHDLFLVVYKGAVDQFRPVEAFLEGALIYLSISLLISAAVRWLDRRWRLPGADPVKGHAGEAVACG